MKKISIVCFVLVICLSSCAWDPPPTWFLKDSYIDQVERIELVKYNNDDFKMVDATKITPKFDSSKTETIEVLDKDKIDEFLSDFEEIIFHVENDSVNEPTGYCLLWYLKNGNFIVFSCTIIKGDRGYSMVSEFDSTDNFVGHIAYFAAKPHYDNVLEKYFKNYISDDSYDLSF